MSFKLALGLCSILLIAMLSASAQAQNNYIPFELGGDNYYNMYGSPSLSASISGTNEFERGDTVTLYVDLTNYGRVLGFKEDQTPQNPKEFALKNSELQEEYKKTTALGIVANLVSNTSDIEVKSGDQVVEALKSGEKTRESLKFTVKIAKHAPAGEYPLGLNLTYDYQDNVRVDAASLSTEGGVPTLVNYRASYIYQKANQTVPISMFVKEQADFEITGASGELNAGGKKEAIDVAYKNIGDEPIRDAVARLSIFKPFSSTDDQAYIGDLSPGEEKNVTFRVDVDSDATPKEYGINSEIKYTDVNGDTVISESMKIPVNVNPAAGSLLVPAVVVLVLIAAAGGYVYTKRQKKA
ncbi:MAG TPA: hypothetical protein VLB04_08915 [Methanotrichaceae archaeon]|nr:hypothetical protein [Methanotrichaceae archaeon]